MQQKDLRLAENLVRELRNLLKTPAGYRETARRQSAEIRGRVAEMEAAIAPLRGLESYHPGVRNLVNDANRLTHSA